MPPIYEFDCPRKHTFTVRRTDYEAPSSALCPEHNLDSPRRSSFSIGLIGKSSPPYDEMIASVLGVSEMPTIDQVKTKARKLLTEFEDVERRLKAKLPQ